MASESNAMTKRDHAVSSRLSIPRCAVGARRVARVRTCRHVSDAADWRCKILNDHGNSATARRNKSDTFTSFERKI